MDIIKHIAKLKLDMLPEEIRTDALGKFYSDGQWTAKEREADL